MERYKEKLKLDTFIYALLASALLIVAVFAALGEAGIVPFPEPVGTNSHWNSIWRGFISGCCTGILGVLLFFIIRNLRALRKDTWLKKLFVKENDERSIKIWASARESAYRTFIVVGLVAGLIAGIFSMAVCITIIACVFFASVIGGLYAIYFSIKF